MNECYFIWDYYWKNTIKKLAEKNAILLWYEVYIDVEEYVIPNEYEKLLSMNDDDIINYLYDYCVKRNIYYKSPQHYNDLNKMFNNLKTI